MKQIISLIFFVSLLSSLTAQETKLTEFSYSEFFKMIENEKDSVFKFQDAIIRLNQITDSLFVSDAADSTKQKRVIDKKIVLNNVYFARDEQDMSGTKGIITNIEFKKDVEINQAIYQNILNCTFDGKFTSRSIFSKADGVDNSRMEYMGFDISKCRFLKGIFIQYVLTENEISGSCNFDKNEVWLDENQQYYIGSMIDVQNIGGFNFINNKFYNNSTLSIGALKNMGNYVGNNEFHNLETDISILASQRTFMNSFERNKFDNYILMFKTDFSPHDDISWDQFAHRLYDRQAFGNFRFMKMANADSAFKAEIKVHPEKFFELYNQYRIENEKTYNTEMGLLGQFYNFYKSKFNNNDANAVYIELKDFETARLKYLFKQSSNFDTFFTLKINQFLKVFSAYGTKPSRAIIFSLYVILLFALIYLFFPNSWDNHGKHRIIHRYLFFMKYMNRYQGIHEVYLEEKQRDLLAYEEFKQYIEYNAKTVPRFFVATALPLYRWALSGTKLTASFLSRFDVLKGTWLDVPEKHRWWRMILLIGAFTMAIIYDITIKILNALMLSINTFTTLGFGEIPIKGLPRYLAIIQGFIGWFMLTIFSVSLISQLLN